MIEELKNVSMNGRMAYAIMCVELYITSKYPHKNWTPLSKQLWTATTDFWDKWFEKTMEFIPEYLFEFKDFESSDFDFISKEEYTTLCELFQNVGDDVNQQLLKLLDIEEIYCYTCIPDYGKGSLEIIQDIIQKLIDNQITPPDPGLVSFSKFSEKYGWGEKFDGTKLSIILNKD